MSPSLSASDLQILLHEADLAARRLLRQLRLSRQDLADLRQEILLDLIARLRAFDPARGALGALAGTIAANRATRIARRVSRERRLHGAVPVSLDEPLPDADGATRGDRVASQDGLLAWHGQPVDAFAAVERRLDVARGLGSLAVADAALCAALAHTTIDRLAASGRGARSSLYRRLAAARLALIVVGLRAA